MEIGIDHRDGDVVLRLNGRLDAYWSTHLTRELESLVRQNHHIIALDFRDVEFLSSAGISVLLRYFKVLQGMHGALTVENPSPLVRNVLDLSGVTQFLMRRDAPQEARTTNEDAVTRRDTDKASLLVYTLNSAAKLTCRIIGEGSALERGAYTRDDCWSTDFPANTFGLGIGALGANYDSCAGRFGEFLAFGGAAFHLPGGGGGLPDYEITRRSFVPTVQVLHGALCHGEFSHLVRFEPRPNSGPMTWTDLLVTIHETGGGGSTGFVAVAETSGLVGAWLKRSPDAEGEYIFRHPAIREWFGYTLEPAHRRSLAWISGIVSGDRPAQLNGFVRPLSRESGLHVHAHALALSYRHISKGKLALGPTVTSMFDPDSFDSESTLGLLHLLNDDRPLTGRGESEFLRGACWLAPIAEYRT